MSDTYTPDDDTPIGTPGDCDNCRDEATGVSTGVYETPEGVVMECPCGSEPEVPPITWPGIEEERLN